MKKKYIILSIITLVLLIAFVTSFNYFKTSNTYVENNSNNQTKITKGISMNLEQTAGAGDYKTVTQSNWPTKGYKFNSELSRCENGSELSWDNAKKTVIVSGNLSDKCYVYFDIYQPTLAEYIKSQYTGTQGDNALYYHNSTLTNGAGDNSYRYAGASDSVNNYICLGSTTSPCPTDNLYRIIGVFGENNHGVTGKQLVKLIKYDYATSNLLGTDGDYQGSEAPDTNYYKGSLSKVDTYYWNYKNDTTINNGKGSNEWGTSLFNKINLNKNYLNNIGTTWSNLIEDATWKVSGHTTHSVTPSEMYTAEITNATKTYGPSDGTSKIGLVYASDYGFAASPSAWTTTLNKYYGKDANGTSIKTINWLYMGHNECTISPLSSSSRIVFGLLNYGDVLNFDASIGYGSRPVLYLKASVLYAGGLGTKDSPITLVV